MRTSSTTRRIILRKKKFSDTPIRNMHEMGEIKRPQELRVDEVSVQKLRENHETIHQLTSQLQLMQEQMNSLNDAGDFQDVESNYSGRLSHVSSLYSVEIPEGWNQPSIRRLRSAPSVVADISHLCTFWGQGSTKWKSTQEAVRYDQQCFNP